MICEQCQMGAHERPGRRGWRYETGHWYLDAWGSDLDYVCRLTPWLMINIWIREHPGCYGGEPRSAIWLTCGHNADRSSRLDLPGIIDLIELKRRALEMASNALESASRMTQAILADLPVPVDPYEAPGVKRLRKAIEKAEQTLKEVRRCPS